eukprot:CAMPEP_0172765794 /NCGR_PEP_ID=MMETSP1074-20121228/179991_1 /TAXON_ID=2916 /ORGANISM="Ceratium fusus, Strain PA161109" /LENGTH=91 /DNA_ID=CAMNT_0013600799 /DNA_START=320 /DNA_END=592 /DNA_ORIENTATION=+
MTPDRIIAYDPFHFNANIHCTELSQYTTEAQLAELQTEGAIKVYTIDKVWMTPNPQAGTEFRDTKIQLKLGNNPARRCVSGIYAVCKQDCR